jgi:thiol:disulfide interchange protein DsbD
MNPRFRSILLPLALLALAPAAGASPISDLLGSTSGGDFLHPDDAFVVEVVSASADEIEVRWTVADGYYMYEHRFGFELPNGGEVSLGEPDFPPGELIEDEFFGESVVHFRDAWISLPVSGGRLGDRLDLTLRFQGCAEAGLCYPPLTREATVVLGGGTAETTDPGAAPRISDQDRMAGLVADGQLFLVLAVFFGLGLLLSLTPCVLPMVPILSSLIIGQGPDITTRRAFGLSLAFVLAMALTYTSAGVLAGMLGYNLQAVLQQPAVLTLFAAIFVLLALAMFGFYELQVPQRFQDALTRLSNRQQAGTYTGVGLMGLLSALIVGPCVAAPLAGVLLVISQTGDPVRGGLALFALSMGMGMLLLVVGTSAGRLVPRGGPWTVAIKAAFGVLLLGVAVWMLERFLPPAVAMSLWSTLIVMSGIYLGAFDATPDGGWRRFWKGAGVLMVAWGLIVLLGAATGGQDPLRPLHGTGLLGGTAVSGPVEGFRDIDRSDEFDRILAEAPGDRPVMLEFYADWCVDCRRMQRYTFSDAEVRAAMGEMTLIKADVTRYTGDHRRLLERFGLFGPPAILFFDPSTGRELRELRLVGEMGAEAFLAHLERVETRNSGAH